MKQKNSFACVSLTREVSETGSAMQSSGSESAFQGGEFGTEERDTVTFSATE